MKKVLSISAAFAITSILAGTAVTNGESSKVKLTDIDAHWGKAAIENAVTKGYVDGFEDKSFRPDNQVTKAEFIKMISVAIGVKNGDAGSGSWYAPYVQSMKDAGILWGTFSTSDMNEPIKRSEMAAVSVHAVDINSKATMLEATSMGLIQGKSNGDLDEEGVTTRAESVTIVERVLSKRKGEVLPVDQSAVAAAEIASTGTNMKSMVGMEPTDALGKWFPIAQGVKVKFEKVIIIDPMKPDPNFNLIDLALKPPFVKLEDTYVIATQIRVLVDSTADTSGNFYTMQTIGLLGSKGTVRAVNKFPGLVKYDKPAEYIGWISDYYLRAHMDGKISYSIYEQQIDLGIHK
ncbi:S-layer homology domain-containing protein [Paenibacillus oryzisoli]|uniref:S-layer homology domain-containing protein n=1 Tax=Paenibacillus oryzisoli TaxID=1850517 RepID=UPI003D2D826A